MNPTSPSLAHIATFWTVSDVGPISRTVESSMPRRDVEIGQSRWVAVSFRVSVRSVWYSRLYDVRGASWNIHEEAGRGSSRPGTVCIYTRRNRASLKRRRMTNYEDGWRRRRYRHITRCLACLRSQPHPASASYITKPAAAAAVQRRRLIDTVYD